MDTFTDVPTTTPVPLTHVKWLQNLKAVHICTFSEGPLLLEINSPHIESIEYIECTH
jgi:hypothetical protein